MPLTPEQIAIREAVAEVFAKLGVEAFRKLSWFPSALKAQENPHAD